MCYRIFFHNLRCDSRPVVLDNQKFLVDPYAKPNECHHCDQDTTIKPWLRCDWHKCCIMTAKTLRCTKPGCDQSETVHTYRRRPHTPGVWFDLKVFDGFWVDLLTRSETVSVPTRLGIVDESVKRWLWSARYLDHLLKQIRVTAHLAQATPASTLQLRLVISTIAEASEKMNQTKQEMYVAREFLETHEDTRGTVFDF